MESLMKRIYYRFDYDGVLDSWGRVQEGEESLPVGMQLMGAWRNDGLLLNISEVIEEKK